MSKSSSLFHVEKTCRTCLNTLNMGSVSLFEDMFIYEKSVIPIKDVLVSSCYLKISQDDGLPYAICPSCMEKVKDLFIFRNQCETAERILQKSLSGPNDKAEDSQENTQNLLKYETLEVIIDEIRLNDNATLLVVEESQTENVEAVEEKFEMTLDEEENVYEEENASADDSEENIPLQKLLPFNKTELQIRPNNFFHCDDCNITFAWRIRYTEHMRKFHKRFAVVKRRQYSCIKCFRAFSIRSKLEAHEQDCKADPIDQNMLSEMTCPHCPQTVENGSRLRDHILLEHSGEHANICHCGKSFKQNSYLKAHLRMHVKDTKYNCAACNKVFCNETNLEKHIRRQHINEHICTICNKTFDNKRKLRLHKTCHTAESDKRFKCKYCEKKFNQLHHLQNHERVHTGQKPYLCNVCGKGFRQQYALTLHMRTHSGQRPYVCSECGKSFNRKQGLDSHQLCHKGGKGDNKVFMCSECGIRLSKLRTLMKHMWQVHKKGEDPSLIKKVNQDKPEKPKKDITYTCNVCHIIFDSDPLLKRHMKTHIMQHICGVCSRAFLLPSQLAAHMRFHDGGLKLHACAEPGCNRTFNRPEHVRAHHMRAHTDNRPYRCEVCLKGFCQTGDLKVHMRYHTGERPYPCTFCDKAFAASSALKGHMRRHTGEKPYQCAICQGGYCSSTELSLHMRSHTSKFVSPAEDS